MERMIIEEMRSLDNIDFDKIKCMESKEQYDVLMMIAEQKGITVEMYKRKGVDVDGASTVVGSLFEKVSASVGATMRG